MKIHFRYKCGKNKALTIRKFIAVPYYFGLSFLSIAGLQFLITCKRLLSYLYKKDMVKSICMSIWVLCISISSFGQKSKVSSHPKLVIGLVIDQMRWDYLYRYYDLYSANGFRRLIEKGFSCENAFIPYVPTYTAPGHTCVYTGSVPAIHGIVGNNWYDAEAGKDVYCASDPAVNTVGSNSGEGAMSPRNLWVTTIGDELRYSTNYSSKVIGIALKDRSAIFPAGHSANAAYWFDGSVGKWISSTYYQNKLPAWVVKENEKLLPDAAMSKDWNTLLPIEKYTQSTADDKIYESEIPGEKTVTFPHRLSQLTNSRYEAFKYTPFANTYTFDMAKEAIDNEKMGMGDVTDLLAVSISSTDYVGHTFGPNSIEAEDTWLRLDADIAGFLQYLDTKLGEGNYLLFLTADHGVSAAPGFMNEHKLPGGTYSSGTLAAELNKMLDSTFNIKNVLISLENNQLYINKNVIKNAGRNASEIQNAIIDFLKGKPYITDAFLTENIAATSIQATIKERVLNGYNPKRSGQIAFLTRPGYLDGSGKGTTHGMWNPYDAHIPLLWFGYQVKQGKTNREVYMSDIAPTVTGILGIQMPSGCIGKVIEEVTR
ncbi:MAG: alkaline phosphatase PafA [Ginsengibacter sp.]